MDIEQSDDETRLILRPNRSFSWRANQYLFLVVTIWLGSTALGFAAMGAWMVLPFVGVELLALAGALYCVSWKLSHCEVLHITRDSVYIAKVYIGEGSVAEGISHPKTSWTLPRADVVVQVAGASHPWGTPSIQFVAKHPGLIRVGEFLNQHDCQQLLQYLTYARLVTRHSEGRVKVAF